MKLFHTYDKRIKNQNGIWLSKEPDDIYGQEVAEFYIDEKVKLADYITVIKYIFKYDVKNFSDAVNAEFACDTQPIEDLYYNIEENGISEDEAYNILYKKAIDTENYYYQFSMEIMMHPHFFTFYKMLKNDGYDGYFFPFEYDPQNIYYFIFDPQKLKMASNKIKKINLTEEDLLKIVTESVKKILDKTRK